MLLPTCVFTPRTPENQGVSARADADVFLHLQCAASLHLTATRSRQRWLHGTTCIGI